MRRWTIRILLAVLILIALAAIATQIVLWTDYPRRIVLPLVQRQLGLRVEAQSMSTGWLGNTTLHDVKLSLPLAEESFFDVPEMQISHTALIPLALKRKFELDALELEKPNLFVRRDQQGRWNVQDVAELLVKSLAGKPEPGTKQRPPRLPRVKLVEGTIRVVDFDGRKSVIAPLDVVGYPEGPLVYRYDATVPDRLKLVGQVAPGESWKHEFNLNTTPGEWLTPWVARVPEPLLVNAQWSGIVHDGSVVGRVVIEQAQADQYGLHGRVAASIAGGGSAVLNPQDLIITTANPVAPKVQIASGAVQVNGTKLKLSQLRVAALSGQAQLDGDADLLARSGDVRGMWYDISAPAPPTSKVRHGGDIELSVRSPFPGRPQVNGSITTRGRTPRGDWEGQITLDGSGRDWANLDWLITLARATWDGRTDYALQDFKMRLTQRDQMIRLADVKWPGHQVGARGQMDLKSKQWSINFNGTDTLKTTFDFSLAAHGNAQLYTLEDLKLSARQAQFKAHGSYDSRKPEPVALAVYLHHFPETLAADEQQAPIKGLLVAEAQVTGTADPVQLKLTGSVRARKLIAFGRDFGDVSGDLNGRITDQHAAFNVRDLALLGGQWHIEGAWPYKGDDRMSPTPDPMRVKVSVADLSLKEVGNLLKLPDASGTARGDWTIDLPLRDFHRDRIAARGELRSGAVALGAADGPLSADEIVVTMQLRNGVFSADPIALSKNVADVRGSAIANVQLSLRAPKQPQVGFAADAWPIRISENGNAAVWAKAQLGVDAPSNDRVSVTGPVNLRAKFATTQQAVGELAVEGKLDGRRGTFEKIVLDALGGSAEGRAVFDADAPNQTNATLTFSGIDTARLAALVPQLSGLSGTYSGTLAASPAPSGRALEPLHVTVGLDPEGEARFRTVALGAARFSAFMNLGPRFIPQRLVLDETIDEIRQHEQLERELDAKGVDPGERPLGWNDIRIAGGRLRLWARRSTHAGDQLQTHLIASFDRLDLDQLVHAFDPNSEPMPARLGGRIVLHGDPRNFDLVLGDGSVRITESELGNVDALALLYDTVAFGTAPKGHTGAGELDLSLQRSTLTLNNIHYFNRGVEAWSNNVTINSIWQTPQSPIFGYVVGTARPLSALKLPFLADVDQIMSVLQSNLTTVKIEGIVADPKTSLATFSDVGEGLQRFMRGQVTAAQSK